MTPDKAAMLKQIQTRKGIINGELNGLMDQLKALRNEIHGRESLIHDLEQQIAALQEKEIIFSEHAVLRYLERAMDMNFGELKKSLLTPDIIEQIELLGDGKYPIPGQHVALSVRNHTVVTVVEV